MGTVCSEGAIVRIGEQKVYLTPTSSGGCLLEDNRRLILVSSECPLNAYEHTACRRALRTYSKCPEYGGKARHSRV